MSLVLDGPRPSDAPSEPEPSPDAARPAATKRRPRRIHRFLVRRRGPFVKVHRWLSFVLLAWVVVESVTGAAIVFASDIDHAWNRDAFTSTPGDVGVDEAIAAAREARPDDLVRYVSTPGSGHTNGMYAVWVTDADGDYHNVLVDPGSGDVTAKDHHEPAAIAFLERLHFDLNSTSIFGALPLTVMGWMAIGWLVVLLSGFYLWYWPGVKRWARALRVRRGRGRFTFHLDLHKAVGIAAFVPLVLIVVTGINFAFPQQTRDVWNAVTFGTYEEPTAQTPLSEPVAGAEKPTADDAAARVAALDGAIDVASVYPPAGSPVGVYTVEAEVDAAFLDTMGGARHVEFAVDQYSGRIVEIEDPANDNTATRAYDEWASQVHFGTIGGLTTEVLWVFVGLAPVVLGVTGTVMWFTRRTKRRARRADPAAPEAPAEPDPDPDLELASTPASAASAPTPGDPS